jgi:murein DD-endopeptidase MepM/ murein hydrolase activator NlpD
MADNRTPRRLRRRAAALIAGLLVLPVTSFGTASAVTPTCPNGTYTVVRNDSWFQIAQRVKVSFASLLAENKASTSTMIHPGNVVCLPKGAAAVSGTTTTTSGPATTAAPTTTTPRPGACTGATHTVVSGNSWSGIAAQYKVSLSAVLAANGATASTIIYPGRTVCLPANATGATTTSSTTTVPGAPPAPSSVRIAQFPVQGNCWFGDTWHAARAGGRLHEGVDIIAKQGQYVYAADAGTLTIQYWDAPGRLAGNGWRLTRADGSYFFYAHLSAFVPGLKVGSKVVAGQIIGFIGSTGSSSTPHLHFEIHPGGGAAVNPTPIVRAVDGCRVITPPPQPDGVVPTPPTGSPTTTTTVPASTPSTTVPAPVQLGAGGPTSSTRTLWQFVSPVMALDRQVAAGSRTTVTMPSLSGVASGTPGAMLRITSLAPARSGFVTVHPCDVAPSSSSLNLEPGRINSTTTVVAVHSNQFCVTSSVATDMRVDVVAALSTSGVGVQPIASIRALDSRTTSVLAANTTRTVSLASMGVPRGARAVTATFTIVDPAAAGTLSIGPCGAGSWGARFGRVAVQSFSLTVRVNDNGLCLRNSTDAHVIVDVTGAWTGSASVTPIGPQRVIDTRGGAPLGNDVRTVPLGGVPAGTSRAMVTVTAIGGGSVGTVVAWPCSQPRPSGGVGATMPGNITAFSVPVAGTELCLTANAPTHAVVDITGAG